MNNGEKLPKMTTEQMDSLLIGDPNKKPKGEDFLRTPNGLNIKPEETAENKEFDPYKEHKELLERLGGLGLLDPNAVVEVRIIPPEDK